LLPRVRRVLGRDPTSVEVSKAVEFIETAGVEVAGEPEKGLKPWEQLAQVLLMSNEMMFLD